MVIKGKDEDRPGVQRPVIEKLEKYSGKRIDETVGFFTCGKIRKLISGQPFEKFIGECFDMEQEQNSGRPQGEINSLDNYRKIFELKEDDEVVYMLESKGQEGCRFIEAGKYKLSAEPRMSTVTGHIHLSLKDKNSKDGIASYRIFTPASD